MRSLLCIALLLCSLPGGQVEARVFKIATAAPDGLTFMKKVRAATKVIDERTEGRVKFKIYPGGVQGDDQTVLRKIKIGQLHGGMLAAGSLTRFFPDLQVYNLPLGFRNYAEADYVREKMDAIISSGLEDAGIITFGLTETGFAYILSNSPIGALSDLDSIKAWVPDNDSIAQNIIRSFGISPVPLRFSDVLPGLQTGLINAIASPPVVVIAMQWHTQVKYLTEMPIMYIYSMLMLDRKAFSRSSHGDQAIVREVMNGVFAEIAEGNRKDNLAAYQVLLGQGIKMVQPAENDLVQWRATADRSINALVESGEISAGIVDQFRRILGEARALQQLQTD